MNKVVIASDSFKGTLTSSEVADSVAKAVRAVFPDCEVVKLKVADGGEGTSDAIISAKAGRLVSLDVSDPLGRTIQSSYYILDDGTALIEMSKASGLTLLSPDERNPLKTSTFGTGQMIANALTSGCRRFLVGIGGSATNDAGIGMLSALGFRFLNNQGQAVSPNGGSLSEITSIDSASVLEGLSESEFTVACDVASPLYGPAGAAFVFAPQKGADADMVRTLDSGLRHFAEVADYDAGFAGAGAAGGLGYAFKAFLNAKMVRGIDMVLDAVGFDKTVQGADLVITGEGRYDGQTQAGKAVYGIKSRASLHGVPVLVVAGSVETPSEDVVCASSDGAFASADDIEKTVIKVLEWRKNLKSLA